MTGDMNLPCKNISNKEMDQSLSYLKGHHKRVYWNIPCPVYHGKTWKKPQSDHLALSQEMNSRPFSSQTAGEKENGNIFTLQLLDMAHLL